MMKHMLQAYVPSVLYFYSMLQLFQTNVAKVDHDVAYVAMAVQVCCKGLFTMFHLCFLDVLLQVCLYGCCICFTHMLQVF